MTFQVNTQSELTIAQQLRSFHRTYNTSTFDRMYGLATLCEKHATEKAMNGSDFKVFTFEDGSEIEMYWS
ncbi:hypothetical protein NVP1084O_241 [Vibrio phage 1.084.O._10N.261.49.F5]|nr:hypothetical protein NVP1084O_241 [Vibrio phage 1.084.O._10N.261.49.F5]